MCRSACQSLRRSVCQSVRRACAGACAGECARACSRHVSRMPTPLATQAPDDLGLKATLQWERPCGDMGLDTALEGKEPGCGSGWRDRPGTEGTTVGQPTQGREWCFIGLEAAGYPASRHGDFPLRRGVMFISMGFYLLYIYESVDSSAGFSRHVFATLVLLAP